MRQQLEELGLKVSHQSGREIICFCPLHEDKHPSFSYNVNTHLFHCFSGCINGRGLLQLQAKLGSKAAPVTVLADTTTTTGKPLPLIPMLPPALDNFGEVFLVARRFNKDTIRDWKLMYWEEEDAVVIPFPDVGFIMRFVKAQETKNKYKYVHGTNISSSLFGLHKFKSDVNNKVVLVEGAFDVIWCHQNGITYALGLMHSDITTEQRYQLIKCGGLYGMVYLMLDKDQGGEKAVRKVGRKLHQEGFRVYNCILPEGSDPNDVDSATLHQAIRDASRWTPV